MASDTAPTGIRLSRDLYNKVMEFAGANGESFGGAVRILVELGLQQDVDLSELTSLEFNARAKAMNRYDELLTEALDKFRSIG